MSQNSKNILITGGAKGLGSYLARHLGSQGHRIVVFDRTASEDLAPDYHKMLAEYLEVDLGDWPAVRECVVRILAKFENRIDILINNAAARNFEDFSAFNPVKIEQCIRVNFQTPVLLTHQLLPIMRQNAYGRVVNIGSRSGFHGYRSGSLYCSTKSALTVFTESVGCELAGNRDDVTINAICPDSFRTREGQNLPSFDKTLATVARTIDAFLNSRRNGEVILVASRRRLLADTLLSLRRHVSWVVRRT